MGEQGTRDERQQRQQRGSPLKTERGSTTIQDGVVSKVAGVAAQEVPTAATGPRTARLSSSPQGRVPEHRGLLGEVAPAGTTRVARLPDQKRRMRVLVTVSPRLYRESVASSIQRGRPDLEVRAASPEEVERELASFGPHLLVHNDALPVPKEALEGVPCRVEMPYSDSMDARVSAGGEVSWVRDMSTEELLRTVAVAATVGWVDRP